MPTFSFDWKFLVALLVAVAGVIVPVFLWQLDFSSRSLSVRLVSSVALQPEAGPAAQDLQVVLDGVRIESPYLSTLELINDGSKPIPASDFETPVELRLNKDRQVVRARISGSQPNGIPAEIITDRTLVKLRPLLLNPKDTLTFAIITSGGAPLFEPQARIAGISHVAFEDTTTKKTGWKRALVFITLALFAFVLYLNSSISLIRPNTLLVSRWGALGTMTVCAIASSLFVRTAYEAIGIETNYLNIGTFSLIAIIIALPTYYAKLRKSRRAKYSEDMLIRNYTKNI